MKNIILSLLLSTFLVIVYGCGKNADNDVFINSDGSVEDQIFKNTGCKVKNPETIILDSGFFNYFADSEGYKYLSGARRTESGYKFWFSKYESTGELIWEVNDAPEGQKCTRAWNSKTLSNGDIVVTCLSEKKSTSDLFPELLEAFPTIISAKNGTANFIKVKDKFMCSYTNVYKDFFIYGIDDRGLNTMVGSYRWYVQISNNGKIMLSTNKMNVPEENAFFISDIDFIEVSDTEVQKIYLDGNKEVIWKNKISLPKHTAYENELKIENGILDVAYKLTLSDGSQRTFHYGVLPDTGEEYKKLTGLDLDKSSIMLQNGNVLCLVPTLTPSDTYSKDLFWESSDEKVATVDDDGTVMAKGEGNCVIKVVAFNSPLKSECTVKVIGADGKEIYLDKEEVLLLQDEETVLTYTVFPENANEEVDWESSDESVATVDQNGKIKALKLGQTDIKVTTRDGKASAICKVKVGSIADTMLLYFPTSSIINIDGYVTGSIISCIKNTGSKEVKLTKFEVRDSNTNAVVMQTTDPENLGLLSGGASKTLNVSVRNVFNPQFIWYFEFKGVEYRLYHYLK